jgi:acetyl esterase/lipase
MNQKSSRVQLPEELIWDNEMPGADLVHDRDEYVINRPEEQNAQGFNRAVFAVTTPTLTVYPAPPTLSTGYAVLIFPGGAYHRLAIDKEGHDVAHWLNSVGVTGVVVKYRTCPQQYRRYAWPDTVWQAMCRDGQRAIRLIRSRSSALGIQPHKIGVLGFSAGGHLAIHLALHADPGEARAGDPIDRMGCRPDFVGGIYPAVPQDLLTHVTAESPPMFLVGASDDTSTPPENTLRLYTALQQVKVVTELHLYAQGQHAFGLGVRGGAVASWPSRFADWLAIV